MFWKLQIINLQFASNPFYWIASLYFSLILNADFHSIKKEEIFTLYRGQRKTTNQCKQIQTWVFNFFPKHMWFENTKNVQKKLLKTLFFSPFLLLILLLVIIHNNNNKGNYTVIKLKQIKTHDDKTTMGAGCIR